MANTITATLYNSEDTLIQSKTYSVQEYINKFNAIIAQSPDEFPQYTIDAVEAIADYGHYTQEFLAESKGWTKDADGKFNGMFRPIDAIHNFNDEDLQSVKDAVSGYTITKNPKNNFESNFIEKAEISLNLDSETSIYFYLTASEDISLLVEIMNLSYDQLAENFYRFKSKGIPAHKLNEEQTLSYTFIYTVVLASASPLAYVNAVLNSEAEVFSTEACRNAMIAIYRYYDCEKKYQEGMKLDSYNLEGAKAYTGTASVNSSLFNYKKEGSDTVSGVSTDSCTFTVLHYSSSSEGQYIVVIYDGFSCIGKVTVTENEGTTQYAVVGTIYGNNNATADIFISSDGKLSTYNTNEVICTLSSMTPRDALATILRKGYELPK